jgi:putative regulator of septum formation
LRAFAGVVASVVVLIAIAGCQQTVTSAQLKVGDCFNYTNTTDANGDPVNVPAPVDCTKAHSDEVFSVFDYPNASGFPGYEAIGTVQQTHCETDFQSYVGVSWERSSYTINYESPDEQGWASGDHAIHCLIEDASGGQLTGSARGTKK